MSNFVPGLAGIPAAKSSISFVDGEKGILEYRGIRIETLSEKSSFEEVAYLLLYGKLPRSQQLSAFTERLVAARPLPEPLVQLIKNFPKTAHPMDALQTGVSAMAMFAGDADYNDASVREEKAIEIIAQTPIIVGLFNRCRAGAKPVTSDPSLSHAANFVYVTTGEKPDPLSEHIMDVSLILHADHTMNASTFAARVTASTLASPYAAISAAVGSLSGSLHGGANERVLEQLGAMGAKENVRAKVADMVANRVKIMGLGHRVYKTKDPRAKVLQKLAVALFEANGKSDVYDIALELEDATRDSLGARGIYPNVDFYSGIVYDKLAIPTDLFTPIFAVSRVAGWLAHWLEQMQDNKTIVRARSMAANTTLPTASATRGNDLVWGTLESRTGAVGTSYGPRAAPFGGVGGNRPVRIVYSLGVASPLFPIGYHLFT